MSLSVGKEIGAVGQQRSEDRPPHGWAAVVGGLVFLLYAGTVAPTTAFWDASEYIAAAHIMGVPHPPGNPLFVVLARAWALLLEPTGLSVAVRVNLFSAAASALAHGLWFLVLHEILRHFSDHRLFRVLGASAGVLVSATAFTVWNQSNVNEKVYTVSLLTIALLSWLAIRWKGRLGRGKEQNLLVLMVFVLALSVGNHLMAFLVAPALAVFVLRVGPKTLLNWRIYPVVAVAAFLGLSIHLFLPIRAVLDPVINEAAPECARVSDALVSVATYGRRGCEPLNAAITRDQYTVEGEPGPGLTGPRQAPLTSQLTNYLQYFDWQWARAVEGRNGVFGKLRGLFTLLFVGLGVWGGIQHFRHERTTFWYFLILFATLSGGLVYYLNFKYGYSLKAPVQDFSLHEARERDYFFIGSFSVWGLWAGLGIAALWQGATARLRTTFFRTAPILGLAVIPLIANWSWANRNYDHAARDWAHNLLMSVEPYGVLFTNGDNDTFPLWYLQEVEGIRRDVTVIVGTYFSSPWYAKQLRDLTNPCTSGGAATVDPTRIICQRPYTANNTDSIYVDDVTEAGDKVPLLLHSPIRVPTKSVLPLDDETIDRVATNIARLDRDQPLQLGGVTVRLRRGQIITPGMQFALTLINESLNERPIYFSSNAGTAASLGLEDQLVRQGLAFKLCQGDPADGGFAGAVRIAGSAYSLVTGDWIDVPRTEKLLDEAFAHHSGIPDDWGHWPYPSEKGVPRFYGWAYLALAEAAVQAGESGRAERYLKRTEAWMALGS